MFFAGLHAFYVHDPGFELVVGHDRPVFDPGLVGVNGINGIFQDLGDLLVVGDAHADEGEDAEVEIEQFVFL